MFVQHMYQCHGGILFARIFFLWILLISLAYNNLYAIFLSFFSFCSCVQSVCTLSVRGIVRVDFVRHDTQVVCHVRHGAIVVFHHWLRWDLSFIDWVNNIHLHGSEIWNQCTHYDKRFSCSFIAYSSSTKQSVIIATEVRITSGFFATSV